VKYGKRNSYDQKEFFWFSLINQQFHVRMTDTSIKLVWDSKACTFLQATCVFQLTPHQSCSFLRVCAHVCVCACMWVHAWCGCMLGVCACMHMCVCARARACVCVCVNIYYIIIWSEQILGARSPGQLNCVW
jgi:hypothetical protein